jgi:hypothetical protein
MGAVLQMNGMGAVVQMNGIGDPRDAYIPAAPF